jgi:hypothetical protein
MIIRELTIILVVWTIVWLIVDEIRCKEIYTNLKMRVWFKGERLLCKGKRRTRNRILPAMLILKFKKRNPRSSTAYFSNKYRKLSKQPQLWSLLHQAESLPQWVLLQKHLIKKISNYRNPLSHRIIKSLEKNLILSLETEIKEKSMIFLLFSQGDQNKSRNKWLVTKALGVSHPRVRLFWLLNTWLRLLMAWSTKFVNDLPPSLLLFDSLLWLFTTIIINKGRTRWKYSD